MEGFDRSKTVLEGGGRYTTAVSVSHTLGANGDPHTQPMTRKARQANVTSAPFVLSFPCAYFYLTHSSTWLLLLILSFASVTHCLASSSDAHVLVGSMARADNPPTLLSTHLSTRHTLSRIRHAPRSTCPNRHQARSPSVYVPPWSLLRDVQVRSRHPMAATTRVYQSTYPYATTTA